MTPLERLMLVGVIIVLALLMVPLTLLALTEPLA